ncbi:hypothetical protein AI28_17805 [bacteria symbiont BFo1 of Frankliniella occidentalis]|nr:hypothetical protein AI28_17805 [bacteria symbiont BFo1 of Frankliniella occidentalis]
MKTQQLKILAQQATPWPWKWFTSNSHNRLSSVPSGKDGDVISAFKAADGAACVSISHDDMAFIEAVHPGVVIELIVRLEAAERANAAQDDHINQQQTRIDWLEAANSGLGKALCAAKSELARRDAAVGECAGVVTGYAVNGCVVSGNKLSIGDHVYTAAQPAVLPGEVEELSMLIRRLVHSLKNSNPHSGLLISVPDYMRRKGIWKSTDFLRGDDVKQG